MPLALIEMIAEKRAKNRELNPRGPLRRPDPGPHHERLLGAFFPRRGGSLLS